jgi:hypothetical protein
LITRYRVGLLLSFSLCASLCGCLFDTGGSGDTTLRIEGYVRDESGEPVPDVRVKAYMNYADGLASVSACSTTTNARGFYRIDFDEGLVEIMIRPAKAGCVFRPPQISYYSPDCPLLNENFTAFCGALHTISGTILDTQGDPVVGVAVTIRDTAGGWSKSVFSSQAGYYLIPDVVSGASYRVTPFLSGHLFDPPERIYESLSRDFEDQDFVASR